MKLIYIEWSDAIANHGWFDKDEMEKWSKETNIHGRIQGHVRSTKGDRFLISLEEEEFSNIVKQVGWLYKETKTCLVIVSRISEDSPSSCQYGNIQKIPKTWIKKRINLSKHIL